MASLRKGWDIQKRVIGALTLRELTTRFGRENIGFLWIMVEPLLFAGLIAILWRATKGPVEQGVDIIAFVISGYIPLVLFRSTISRSVSSFTANGGLMYHRQIKVLDLITVRFLVEFLGHLMAYVFVVSILTSINLFPRVHDYGILMIGWLYISLFTFSIALIIAPLSEFSEVVEKIVHVANYIMVPFSGAFFLVGSLSPQAAEVALLSPSVHAMEMMRYGIFGPNINPQFSFVFPLEFILPCMVLGLLLCRVVRQRLIIE